MARPKKTDRVDDIDDVSEDFDRDPQRDNFEQPMLSDTNESPLHIPRDVWPEGRALRWVRVEAANAPDNANWSKMTRAGWTPVPRGKYKQIDERYPSVPMPGVESTTGAVIIFGGLCLCERDMRLETRDKKKQQQATADANRTVETYVEGGNSNFPRRDFGTTDPQFERSRAPAQFKE